MIFKTGNLFSDKLHNPPDIRLFSSNGTVKANGELVMGAGAALAARKLAPATPHTIGDMLLSGQYPRCGRGVLYGLVVIRAFGVGAFQTKCNYWEKSSYELIELSSMVLRVYALANADLRIAMNFPGIGYGGLSREVAIGAMEKHLSEIEIEVWEI